MENKTETNASKTFRRKNSFKNKNKLQKRKSDVAFSRNHSLFLLREKKNVSLKKRTDNNFHKGIIPTSKKKPSKCQHMPLCSQSLFTKDKHVQKELNLQPCSRKNNCLKKDVPGPSNIVYRKRPKTGTIIQTVVFTNSFFLKYLSVLKGTRKTSFS